LLENVFGTKVGRLQCFYNTFNLLMLKCLINNVVRHRTYCQYNRVLCTLFRNALIISNEHPMFYTFHVPFIIR